MQSIPIKPSQEPFFKIPFWRAPSKNVYEERAIRFGELIALETTQWSAYLLLLKSIAQAQHQLLNSPLLWALTPVQSPSPLLVSQMVLPDTLKTQYQAFYALIQDQLPSQAKTHWQQFLSLHEKEIKNLAQHYLTHDEHHVPEQYRIWIHAVLEVLWTAQAIHLNQEQVPERSERQYCPCCGSQAVAGLILNKGEDDNLRYLQCSLCNSLWYALQAKCTFCANTKDITLISIQGQEKGALHGAIAEVCPSCHAYRKLLSRKKEQYADVIADDMASLVLDVLVGEEGYARGGHNPYFIQEENITQGA